MHTKQTKILHKNEKTKRNNIMKKYKNYTDVTVKNKTKHNLTTLTFQPSKFRC